MRFQIVTSGLYADKSRPAGAKCVSERYSYEKEKKRDNSNCPLFAPRESLVLLLFRLLVVQENEAEEKEADHHGKGGGIVRIGGDDEALVLRVLQRSNGDLANERRRTPIYP